ncbi:MAG: ATP-binding protein [Azospirillaceae bacterium]|nr:ATP-binding protein [Azospirillaceae bacterium]
MMTKSLPFGRHLVAALLAALPTLAMLVWLAPPASLCVAIVIAVGLAIAILLALTVRASGQDQAMILEYLARLSEREPVPLPDGCPTAVRAVSTRLARLHRDWLRRVDGVERKLAANELILDALHDPLILIDQQRRVVRANGAARNLLGERIAERDLPVTIRNPHVLAAVEAVLAGAGSRSVEFLMPGPVERVYDARIKPFHTGEAGSSSQPDAAAPDRSVILTFHDMTAVKRSEQMRADFVANASHELRTPLSALLGFIETLRGPAREDPEARDRFLSIMQDQAGRMSRLVSDLLSLSRIEQDEHTLPSSKVDIIGVVDAVVAGLELKAAARRTRLHLDMPEEVPEIFGDADQIAQVFQNLIDNAIKYSREQTEILVSVTLVDGALVGASRGGDRAANKMVCIAVTDQGDGIPRTHLPRLTERFYRVDPARSRQLGGTGLGLAIVKHIVNRHRGRMTIESEVGRGSIFSVYLPVSIGEQQARAPALSNGAAA